LQSDPITESPIRVSEIAISFHLQGNKTVSVASMYVCNPDSSLSVKEMLTEMEIQFDQPHENKNDWIDCGALLFRNGTVCAENPERSTRS